MNREVAMIDHISVHVRDFAKAKAFYDPVMAALGATPQMDFPPHGTGYGFDGHPTFWFGVAEGPAITGGGHIAFAADNRAFVDAFYAAAIKAGGTDNGAPGLRPHYHPTYYAAFVIDPDGNRLEAVCHKPA
jgi:catechol 2,3-dioxygenase-like lactoylglutathione lyase family enzyme